MDNESDIVAVKDMLNQYAKGCNTGDFDFWMSLWADYGVQMPPDAPAVVGKEQIRENMKPVFDQFNYKVVVDILEAKVYGDLGLTRCNGTVDLTPKAGGETIHTLPDGKALTYFRSRYYRARPF